MNIFHVITSLDDGGAEAVLFRLCYYDRKNQHLVVSLMGEGKYGSLLREAGVPVFCLEMSRGKISLRGLWKLLRLFKEKEPDIVQTWMYHADLVGGVIARLAGIRNICWGIHNTTLETGSSRKSTILVARFCAKLSRWVPRIIIYCANKARQVHEERGYDATKSKVISNGYDLSKFSFDSTARKNLRKEFGLSEMEILFGMVGRFDPPKDHFNLLNALAELKKTGFCVRCLLVGNGVNNANKILTEKITEVGLDSERELLLLDQRKDIPSVMSALDVHVLSSSAEAFPNVLAEAMACATPCVTTDVGDASLIVGNTGWVVPPRNSVALASALGDAIKSMQDRPYWKQRQLACRKRIESKFSLATMVINYNHVWQSMMPSIRP